MFWCLWCCVAKFANLLGRYFEQQSKETSSSVQLSWPSLRSLNDGVVVRCIRVTEYRRRQASGWGQRVRSWPRPMRFHHAVAIHPYRYRCRVMLRETFSNVILLLCQKKVSIFPNKNILKASNSPSFATPCPEQNVFAIRGSSASVWIGASLLCVALQEMVGCSFRSKRMA